MTRDRSSYVENCRKTSALFTNTINPYVAERVVKDCLLWPEAPVDLNVMDRLADVAILRGVAEAGLPSFQVAKALAMLREKRFVETIDWAKRARDGSSLNVRGQACALLAMGQWKLGAKKEARAMLEEGYILAPKITFAPNADNLGADWLDWLMARILLDEAASFIRSETP